MKQSLQLKLGQNLTMTPQLQQAIRLLQLSTLELQTEVQMALESNPMLEQDEGTVAENGEPPAEVNGSDRDSKLTAEGDSENIPDELPVDSNWEDVFDTGATSYSAPDTGGRDIMETVTVSSESLQDHLVWQLEMTNLSDTDLMIARTVIDAIDEDGYLTIGMEDIRRSLASSIEVEADEIEAVIHRIQQLDPIGVCARDLQENLLLQLQQFDMDSPWLREAQLLVRDHFGLLSNRDYNRICSKMKLDKDELQQVINLIQSLNPCPGSTYNTTEPEYIIPDVYVFKKGSAWQVELNPDSIPKLRINSMYANMIKRGSNSRDNNYLRDNLQEARWFLKSLQSRHETLLKVATCIVERQHGFLDHGEEAMRPMVLRSIAETDRDARIDRVARNHAQVHAYATRHLRVQVFLLQPCFHGSWRRTFRNRDPRHHQEAGRSGKPGETAERQQDGQRPGRPGYQCRSPHYRQVPGVALHITIQRTQAPLVGVTRKRSAVMQISLTGNHVDLTEPLREYVNTKMERLERHFDIVQDIHVVLSVEKLRHKAEATVLHKRQQAVCRLGTGRHVCGNRCPDRQARPPGKKAQGKNDRPSPQRGVHC